jgi:CO/xanthine dehydrogenase FAD-binding subunit
VPIDHVIGGLTDIAERMAAASGRTYHLVSGAPVPVAALRDRSRCPRCHGRRRERPAGDRATAAAAAKAPSLLVDLRRVPGLGNIAVGESGVRLGARVRWRDLEHDRRLATAHPLLREAVAHVAHYQIRNRGTVGGSLAHADPAAELPGIAVTCDAEITLVGAAGARTIRAGEFFTGSLSTVRQAGEIITELHLPFWPRYRRWAFEEFGPHDAVPIGKFLAP